MFNLSFSHHLNVNLHIERLGNHRISHEFRLNGNIVPDEYILPIINQGNYSCPDNATEVVAFAPNSIPLELNVTEEVYNAAILHNLTSVLLLEQNATTENFLNYIRCPKLKYLFYDGDADRSLITTFDGVVSYKDFKDINWRYELVTYWLACEAFNDPMLSAITNARPKRWAAGRNDLFVGPSDEAASEAMIAAISGSPLEESFNEAVKTWDQRSDHWGFGGFGSDFRE